MALIRDDAVILDLLNSGDIILSRDVAKVMSAKTSQRRIRRIGLQKDGLQIRAAFRDKSVRIAEQGSRGPRYHDSYYNELAAYLVSRYLGLDIIPATVLRSIPISASGLKRSSELRQGTLQLWVENAIVEFDLSAKKIPYPGNLEYRNEQFKEIFALDCVIGNVDRHAGNLLIDMNARFQHTAKAARAQQPYRGKVWAIDHSRAFHERPRLDESYCRKTRLGIRAVSLVFMQRMRVWDLDEIELILLSSGLSARQIQTLNLPAMDRRAAQLKEHFDAEQLKSGLTDEEFYSSGIWHQVR